MEHQPEIIPIQGLEPKDLPCHGRDMFPDMRNEKAVEAAKAVCTGCPVKAECLQRAKDYRIGYGVWGGTTNRERGIPPSETPSWSIHDLTVKFLRGTTPEEYQLKGYDEKFDDDEWDAATAARQRRQQILARVDAELASERRNNK